MATTLVSQTRRIYCRNNCGVEIGFDSRKSKSGKSIPIEIGSGLPHQCPKSPYVLQQKQESSTEKRVKEAQTAGLGQITRKNGVTITELKARVTDILERIVVLESAIMEYQKGVATSE